ncbi:MAG: aminodeoxychorismate/anthranilate synthase component II [Proteobacteria bacterium]|nr:aminodeoxychorismate/anthranilate synthase component II [Pseudomonadota bacterium]
MYHSAHISYPVVFVDHYDSFSWNIIELLAKIPPTPHIHFDIRHVYYDSKELFSLTESLKKACFILSPGPKSPHHMQSSQKLYHSFKNTHPFLGICLGHQIMGICEGYTIKKATAPFHGTTRLMSIKDDGGYFCKQSSYQLASYNSLCLDKPPPHTKTKMNILAYDDKGDIAAIGIPQPTTAPIALGIQLHPESFLSKDGDKIVRSFLWQAAAYHYSESL